MYIVAIKYEAGLVIHERNEFYNTDYKQVFLSAMVQRLLYPTCSLLSLLFASRYGGAKLGRIFVLTFMYSVFFCIFDRYLHKLNTEYSAII